MAVATSSGRELAASIQDRFAQGPGGFPEAKRRAQELFRSQPARARALALEAVDALVNDRADDKPARRHDAICAMLLDVACQESAPPAEPAEALRAEAAALGRAHPTLLRKLAATANISLDTALMRTVALEAAHEILRAGELPAKEAAMLFVDARASASEIGERVWGLIDALVEKQQWPAATALASRDGAWGRHAVACCMARREHKRAIHFVEALDLRPRSEFEEPYVALEIGRVHWLLKSGHEELVLSVLRDAARALASARQASPLTGTAAEGSAPAADAWVLSVEGTVAFVRRVLGMVLAHASSGTRPHEAPQPARECEVALAESRAPVAQALLPPLLPAEACGWWSRELAPILALPDPFGASHDDPADERALALPLGDEGIAVVDDAHGVDELARRLAGATEIGLDVEWRPQSFLAPSRCALLQLALWDRVYLVDLLALVDAGDAATTAALDQALSRCFHDERTRKLCFGHEDLRSLHASYPRLLAFAPARARGWVCVQKAFGAASASGALCAEDGSPIDAAKARAKGRQPGLSTACELVLGKPLDKSAQMSDWERRPLTQQQMRYAASDAHVLLRLDAAITRSVSARPAESLHSPDTDDAARLVSSS